MKETPEQVVMSLIAVYCGDFYFVYSNLRD